MKRWLLIALAACSSKSSAPPPAVGSAGSAIGSAGSATPVVKHEPPRRVLIDLPKAGVSNLDVHPTIDHANHVVAEWNSLRRDVVIACREDAYNLVSSSFDDPLGTPEGSHVEEWFPGPFSAAPTLCEIRFYGEHHERLADACYRSGTVTPGDCGLPPVQLPQDRSAILLDHVKLGVAGKRVGLDALFTLVPAMPGRQFAQTLRCGGATGHAVSDDSHLDRLEMGDSRYVIGAFDMSRDVPKEPPPKCQLDVTTTTPPDKTRRTLATFCIANDVATSGPCK